MTPHAATLCQRQRHTKAVPGRRHKRAYQQRRHLPDVHHIATYQQQQLQEGQTSSTIKVGRVHIRENKEAKFRPILHRIAINFIVSLSKCQNRSIKQYRTVRHSSSLPLQCFQPSEEIG